MFNPRRLRNGDKASESASPSLYLNTRPTRAPKATELHAREFRTDVQSVERVRPVFTLSDLLYHPNFVVCSFSFSTRVVPELSRRFSASRYSASPWGSLRRRERCGA